MEAPCPHCGLSLLLDILTLPPHPCSEMLSFTPPLPFPRVLRNGICPVSLSLSALLRPPGWPVLVPRRWFLKVMEWKVTGPPLSSVSCCQDLEPSGPPHWLFWRRPHLAPPFCTDRPITASALASYPKLQSMWDGCRSVGQVTFPLSHPGRKEISLSFCGWKVQVKY